jgi:CRP-like cAMP-binding protein
MIDHVISGEHARLLQGTGWLSHTPEDFRAAVLDRSAPTLRTAGQPLYHTGDATNGLFGVCHGVLQVSIPLPLAGADLLHLGQPGFWIGGAAALTATPRNLDVSARTDCVLAHLSLAALQSLVTHRPEWWRLIGLLVVLNLEITHGAARDLLIRDAQLRCVAVLLRLCGARHADPMDAALLQTPATQSELAGLARMSRNAVGDILRDLAERGLIALRYRSITVLAPAALRGMLEPAGAGERA